MPILYMHFWLCLHFSYAIPLCDFFQSVSENVQSLHYPHKTIPLVTELSPLYQPGPPCPFLASSLSLSLLLSFFV